MPPVRGLPSIAKIIGSELKAKPGVNLRTTPAKEGSWLGSDAYGATGLSQAADSSGSGARVWTKQEPEGSLTPHTDSVVLSESDLSPGSGMGVVAYLEALRSAHSKGLDFASDSIVSKEAQNVWYALERRGIPVIRDQKAKTGQNGVLRSSTGPVFRIRKTDVASALAALSVLSMGAAPDLLEGLEHEGPV